jgi:SAM-dependent methyltransferase
MQFLWKIKKYCKKVFRLNLNSEDYWIRRYDSGGNSGLGSYGKLAEFKAEIINDFVRTHNIKSVIDFGCGDGNQVKLIKCPSYLGFDISLKAIELCRETFPRDKSKVFGLMGSYWIRAHLTLSLDVIYHLLEDDVYYTYMERLFGSSTQFVIIYSSNYDEEQDDYIKRRKFIVWVSKNKPKWELIQYIPNKYPRDSRSNFYIYGRIHN